jgi:hypothetical protein
MPITGTAYTPAVAPGIHQAVITKIEDVESKTDPGSFFRGWEFTLSDGSGLTVRASSSLATSPKSKGGKWIAALIGHPLGVGETVELIGMHCTIVVGLKDNGYETVETVAAPDAKNKAKAHAPVIETVTADEQTEIGVLP